MRHVSCEFLARLDAFKQCARHGRERAAHLPDFIAAASKIRQLLACCNVLADVIGGFRQTFHGACNEAGQQQRAADREQQRDAGDLQDQPALVPQNIVDIARQC